MQSRTVCHWQSRRDDRAITLRILEIVETRIRYGCPRIHIQLQGEGWLVNHKKTHRIYCLEGLNLRRKRSRRHLSAAHRQQRSVLTHIDQFWSMDFVSDNLFKGQRSRALTVSIYDRPRRGCPSPFSPHRGPAMRLTLSPQPCYGMKRSPRMLWCQDAQRLPDCYSQRLLFPMTLMQFIFQPYSGT